MKNMLIRAGRMYQQGRVMSEENKDGYKQAWEEVREIIERPINAANVDEARIQLLWRWLILSREPNEEEKEEEL